MVDAAGRVFVFDDDPSVRSMLIRRLEQEGHEVFAFPCAVSCDHCPCAENQTCADVILSDVSMPGLNGLDFIDRQLSVGCRVRGIGLMSGVWSPESVSRAQDLGCRVFEKPIDTSKLCRWVARCIKRFDRELSPWYVTSRAIEVRPRAAARSVPHPRGRRGAGYGT